MYLVCLAQGGICRRRRCRPQLYWQHHQQAEAKGHVVIDLTVDLTTGEKEKEKRSS